MWTAVQEVTLAHALVCEFNPLTRLITCKRHRRKTYHKSDHAATCTKHLCSLAHSLSHRGFIQQPEHCQADWAPRRLIVPGGDHGIGVPSILVEGSDCRSIESIQLLMELEQISYVGTECDQDGVRDIYKLLDQCAYL